MTVRFGRILYCVGLFLAALAIVAGGVTMVEELSRYSPRPSVVMGPALVALIAAAAFSGLGYAARYVLANETGPLWPFTRPQEARTGGTPNVTPPPHQKPPQ